MCSRLALSSISNITLEARVTLGIVHTSTAQGKLIACSEVSIRRDAGPHWPYSSKGSYLNTNKKKSTFDAPALFSSKNPLEGIFFTSKSLSRHATAICFAHISLQKERVIK